MKSLPVRSLVLAALFSALLAVCSWISVPAAVPFPQGPAQGRGTGLAKERNLA